MRDIRRHIMASDRDIELLPSDYLNWDGTFKRKWGRVECVNKHFVYIWLAGSTHKCSLFSSR